MKKWKDILLTGMIRGSCYDGGLRNARRKRDSKRNFIVGHSRDGDFCRRGVLFFSCEEGSGENHANQSVLPG